MPDVPKHWLPTGHTIITTGAIRDGYAAALTQIIRRRHEAAYEWTRLRWWEWRKRRRLYRLLFGIGGWRASGLEDTEIPERVVLRGPLARFRQLIERGRSDA